MGKINGRYLKELRRKRNLKAKDIAKLIGVGESTYYKWECGSQRPSILKLQMLQIIYKELDYNKLLTVKLKKCYNGNCINRERGNNEIR